MRAAHHRLPASHLPLCTAHTRFAFYSLTHAAIDRYGLDMTSEFRTQGATQYGTITKSRFNSIMTTTFGIEKDHFWDDAKLNILAHHYGTGSADIFLKGKMQVAWMDLCEDLGETDASFVDNQYAHGQVQALAFSTHL